MASEIALKKHYIILLSMAANVIISSNSIASTQLYAVFFVRGLFILKYLGGFPQFFFTELRIKLYEKIWHSNILKLYMKIKKHEILNKQEWLFFSIRLEKKLQPLNGIVIHANHFSVFFFLPRTEPGLSRLSIFSRRVKGVGRYTFRWWWYHMKSIGFKGESCKV